MLRLQPESLDWALAHAERQGDSDVFPAAFEFNAIRHDWATVRDFISTQNILEWSVRPARSLLFPKARYGFRVITQLDPLDFLVYAALTYEVGADIEARRPPQARGIVCSYRYLPDANGQLFDPNVGYSSFLTRCKAVLEGANPPPFVGTADISDFYPRIYHHRLDNALQVCTTKQLHSRAIRRLLAGWNGTETFGIPVGSAPSRLLAEATIADVDEALLANGVNFVRYNDDYRIFGASASETYRSIALLADTLFRNHGLTLQQSKTHVYPANEFAAKFLTTPRHRELDQLHERFDTIVEELGLEDPYEPIEYDDLDAGKKELVDSLNLYDLVREEIEKDEPDFGIIRFGLRRLTQLGDNTVNDSLLDRVEALHPMFSDIIRFLEAQQGDPYAGHANIGQKILDLLDDSILSELPFHRMWGLELFARSTVWGNGSRVYQLLGASSDSFTRRQLILAIGRARQRHWFQSQWRNLFDEPHWTRRALIYGASCLPADARAHWYRSIDSRLDPLERAVAKWAQANPLG